MFRGLARGGRKTSKRPAARMLRRDRAEEFGSRSAIPSPAIPRRGRPARSPSSSFRPWGSNPEASPDASASAGRSSPRASRSSRSVTSRSAAAAPTCGSCVGRRETTVDVLGTTCDLRVVTGSAGGLAPDADLDPGGLLRRQLTLAVSGRSPSGVRRPASADETRLVRKDDCLCPVRGSRASRASPRRVSSPSPPSRPGRPRSRRCSCRARPAEDFGLPRGQVPRASAAGAGGWAARSARRGGA